VLSSATFALNPKTDLNASYAFSKSDYAQTDLAGLPLGVNYERNDVRAGITRRFPKNLVANLTYGFSQYREPTSGGASDFTAQTIFATVSFPWP